jgi:hypothetical protein
MALVVHPSDFLRWPAEWGDRPVLPVAAAPDVRPALQFDVEHAAQARQNGASGRRGRRREVFAPPCYCGLRHMRHLNVPCEGVAVNSAANFHHYLTNQRCPAIPVQSLGSMVRICPDCHAKFFLTETINCCQKGTVSVPIPNVPDRLHSVITSRTVITNIRVFNMALSMASTGHQNMSPGWGMFTLGGKTYHRMSATFVNPRGPPAFAQIYMLDTAAATARRQQLFPAAERRGASHLDASTLSELHDLLLAHNPWIGSFRSAGMNNVPELEWHSCSSVNIDGMGLGAMIEGSGPRNVVIRVGRGNGQDDAIHNIDDRHALYHPLAYVLLFPTGSGGWASVLSRRHPDGTDAGKLTLTQWALYIIQRRVEGPSHLQSCGALTSEFWCDVWAQVESSKLGFLRQPHLQASIRSCRFNEVGDCLRDGGDLAMLGTPVIMPASFVGSAQWYRALYHDAMALPAYFGRPDVFLTMTCNPKWPEITDNVPDGDDPLNHPDLVARVFFSKWMALLNDVTRGHIFGVVLAFCWRIEWQFRGWPHVHCMIILRNKLLSAHQIDGIISAEIPDPVQHPELHQLVKEFMIHGPFCGDMRPTARCRQKNPLQCRFRFSKARQESTVICDNQFPLYRRRQRHTAVVKGHVISDEWVVPHNALLLLRYRCHVNLEVVSHMKVTKYCYKYVFKKPDEATIVLDQIEHYISSRVLSAGEAVWRILGLRLHQESPPVFRLDLHLPQQHTVCVNVGSLDDVARNVATQTTTLLQWFLLNQRDPGARQFKCNPYDCSHNVTFLTIIRYSEIPRHYVWVNASWQQRQRDTRSVGRIYVTGFHDSELFYLRRLLCIVRGATSWHDIRSFLGISYPTFKETCSARGMLLDDGEYIDAMHAICATACSVDSLRHQFVCMLVHCTPSNAATMFEMFVSDLCGCEDPQSDDVQCTLWAMEGYCNIMGWSLTDFGLPLPSPRMIVDYAHENYELHCRNRDAAFAQFSDEQLSAAQRILAAVHSGRGGVFCLQASGGCGKTFWANGVSAALNALGSKPIVVAATGLAAQMLTGGQTAHRSFGIPCSIDEHSFCHVNQETKSAIINSSALIWDECSMVHVDVANCVNRSLQDWMGNTALFGGKVVIFMGDFQQLLPVVRRGSGDTATIMAANWWNQVQCLQFTRNFRSDDREYCALLRQVGLGQAQSVTVPASRTSTNLEEFCMHVFGDYTQLQRHVVCLTLQDAAFINSFVMSRLPGITEYSAAGDVKIDCKNPDLYSDEFMQSQQIPGAPPAVLECKVGARCKDHIPFDLMRC